MTRNTALILFLVGGALALVVGIVTNRVADVDAEVAAIDAPAGSPTTQTTVPAPDFTPLTAAPPVLRAAPDLVELDGWLQSDATTLTDARGEVTILQFWTFACRNCKNTLDTIARLYDTYEPAGLEVVGVHAPEFDFEADPVRIAEAATELGVDWQIALDTDKTNFRSWQEGRRFWPRTYIIDADGNIRYDWIGEGNYDELEATVAWLLENPGA